MTKSNDKIDFQVKFGNRLESLRIEKDISYRKLAQRCGIDHSNISKIAKGEINIQLSTVFELSKALEVHPKELFDFNIDLDKE